MILHDLVHPNKSIEKNIKDHAPAPHAKQGVVLVRNPFETIFYATD